MIYLASPYSHADPAVLEARFQIVCRQAARLMREGHHIFSPIAHTHPIALAGGLPLGWDFWEKYDRDMLNGCEAVWVLQLDGWETSKGVAAEIRIANEMGIPVRFVELED